MNIHFVCEKVIQGQIRVLRVSSRDQIADIFTRSLLPQLFYDLRDSFDIRKVLILTMEVYWIMKYSLLVSLYLAAHLCILNNYYFGESTMTLHLCIYRHSV
jgi:hypothetical protein